MATVPIPAGAQVVGSEPESVPNAQPDYGNVKPVVPGNIQFYGRTKVAAPKGTTTPEGDAASFGTVHSASREENGLEVLFPTIYDGKWHSVEEGWQHYKQTGEHMGKFASAADADEFANKYHQDAAAGKYDAPPRKLPGSVPIPQGAQLVDREPANDPAQSGYVINDVGNKVIVPKDGESFSEVMKRAAEHGRSVQPEEVRKELSTAPEKVAETVAAAPVIGAAGAAALAGPGDAAAVTQSEGEGVLPSLVAHTTDGVRTVTAWAAKNPVQAYLLFQVLKELVPGAKKMLGIAKAIPSGEE